MIFLHLPVPLINNENRGIKMSVFSKKYWLSKGMSDEEAIYQISIRRPNNVLYYINKGFSQEEAIEKVTEYQKNSSKKRGLLSTEEKRKLSPRCIEFYLNKGLPKEEAQEMLSQFQRNFSKEICIKKYGVEKGTEIWKLRQEKWQKTLTSKPIEEIKEINRKKNRWKNLSNDDSNTLKLKVSNSVKNTVSKRSLEDKRKVGKNISNGKVKFGYAIPREQLPAFELYKSKVWNETKKHNLNLLENYHLRGKKSYHLDHQYSIWQGFIDNTPAEIVGHICNLKMLNYKENLSKHTKCELSLAGLKKLIKDFNDKN